MLHEKGIVHRDLKPANILIRSTGVPVVGDLGLATDAEDNPWPPPQRRGRPFYRSPEQVRERGPGRALRRLQPGVIIYEALTARPFEGSSTQEVNQRILERDPRAPRQIRRQVPGDLETICMQAAREGPRTALRECRRPRRGPEALPRPPTDPGPSREPPSRGQAGQAPTDPVHLGGLVRPAAPVRGVRAEDHGQERLVAELSPLRRRPCACWLRARPGSGAHHGPWVMASAARGAWGRPRGARAAVPGGQPIRHEVRSLRALHRGGERGRPERRGGAGIG